MAYQTFFHPSHTANFYFYWSFCLEGTATRRGVSHPKSPGHFCCHSNHSWKQIFRGKHKLPFRDPKDATTEIWYKSLDFAVAILIEADNPFLYITLSFASSLNASWSALPLFNRENVFRSCWKQQTGQPVKPSYQWLKIPLKYEYSSTLSTSKWTVNIEVVTCYPCLWNRILQNILDM